MHAQTIKDNSILCVINVRKLSALSWCPFLSVFCSMQNASGREFYYYCGTEYQQNQRGNPSRRLDNWVIRAGFIRGRGDRNRRIGSTRRIHGIFGNLENGDAVWKRLLMGCSSSDLQGRENRIEQHPIRTYLYLSSRRNGWVGGTVRGAGSYICKDSRRLPDRRTRAEMSDSRKSMGTAYAGGSKSEWISIPNWNSCIGRVL